MEDGLVGAQALEPEFVPLHALTKDLTSDPHISQSTDA